MLQLKQQESTLVVAADNLTLMDIEKKMNPKTEDSPIINHKYSEFETL